ncbi:maleylpyruvate isomerase family mycothiol-dependent enzyme [Dactylosporangium sp. CS-033363]|uniref:maleylpyruvate isomerase family mycothiol-dependent enzyme n=1 Tax=Dactylosporangium sp. CS-033363 TaxID=3239935 RepID=UPI003D93A279
MKFSWWPAVDEQRAAVADLLASLTPDEWSHPSLCTQWTVREVAAHLTLQQLTVRDLLARTPLLVRAKGNLDRGIHDMAVARTAEVDDAGLVALIRASIGSRRAQTGVTPYETLTDMLVHGQDIAIPLGRDLPMPPDAAAAAATRMMTMHWPRPFPIKKTLLRYSLLADDTAWQFGNGPAIEGPMSALLLLVCGRLAALDQLRGPGLESLRAGAA